MRKHVKAGLWASCLLISSAFTASAQKGKVPSNSLKGADQFGKTITAADLKKHLYIVAGEEMQGRETATEGQRKAAAYLIEHFKKLGLTPGNGSSYEQEFPVYEDVFEESSLQIDGKNLKLDQDFTVNIGLNHNALQRFSEVVYVNEGLSGEKQDDYKGLDVSGKLVLIRGVKADPSGKIISIPGFVNQKIQMAMRKGAAAVLFVQSGFPRKVAVKDMEASQSTTLFRKTQMPNTYFIAPEVASAILGKRWEEALQGKLLPVAVPAEVEAFFQKKTKTLISTNVLAVVEGTDKKDEYVFVTAHYDHIGMENGVINYGADDDGSGTVSLLEMAEAFSKAKAAGKGPRRSIVFMAVSGEEKGLWGSAYYANHPIFSLEKTVVDLNIDMIGRVGSDYLKLPDSLNYVYVIGDDKLSSDLRPISETANKKFVNLILDYRYNDPKDPNRFYYRSDHYNFAAKGVPVIFYFNGVHADYHRPGDTPDKINYPLMEKRARLVFYTAWEMANREAPLKRDIPLN